MLWLHHQMNKKSQPKRIYLIRTKSLKLSCIELQKINVSKWTNKNGVDIFIIRAFSIIFQQIWGDKEHVKKSNNTISKGIFIKLREKKVYKQERKRRWNCVMSKYFIGKVKKVRRWENRLMSTEMNVPSLLNVVLNNGNEGNSVACKNRAINYLERLPLSQCNIVDRKKYIY